MKVLTSIFVSVLFLLTACGGTSDIDELDTEPAPEVPDLTQADCFNETVLYEVPGTPMKFCYKEVWGEPVTEEQTVSFPNSEGPAPTITYVKDDKVEGPLSHFDSFSLTLPEKEIAQQFVINNGLALEDFNIKKAFVSDKRAARVHYYNPDELVYYVQDAFDDSHVEIRGSFEIAEEIDDLAQLMVSF